MTISEDILKDVVTMIKIEENVKKAKEQLFEAALKDAELPHEGIEEKSEAWFVEMHEKLEGKGYSFVEFNLSEDEEIAHWYLCRKNDALFTGRVLKVFYSENSINVEVNVLSPSDNKAPSK